tara:strand:+ start:2121 stop:2450 length:330 start_codon:yes stop_codon:yes gene_type:complete
MILKVLQAMFTENEQNLPKEWPVEASPLKEGEELKENWLKMTLDELDQLRAAHLDEYKDWARRRAVIQAELNAEAKTKRPENRAQNKLKEMGFEDDEIHCILKWKKFDG